MSLRLTYVTLERDGVRVLDGVSFEVSAGSIVAIVGANGAGKTSVLDVASGILSGFGGVVEIDGSSLAPRPRAPHPGVARVFQGSPLPSTLTVREVARLATTDDAAADALLRRFGLFEHEVSFVAELSTGMRRILDLAVASTRAPRVLLLDEPASGLAQAEIEHLASVIRGLRDETGAAVVVVEHDAWLVRAIADEVVVMDGGRVVARGDAGTVLSVRPEAARARVHDPRDERFARALTVVAAARADAPPLVRRSLSTWTIARLGLRQFSAGLASVLVLGLLSRVLKVEYHVGFFAVASILATYNLAAPIGLVIGHRSDSRTLLGYRRTSYVVLGAALTAAAVAATPLAAQRLSSGASAADIALAVGAFVAMGIGMYGSGTAFYALIADISGPSDRTHVAKVMYLEFFLGVSLGVGLTAVVGAETPRELTTLFGLAAVVIVTLTAVAVWGHEPRARDAAPRSAERARLVPTLRAAWGIAQARSFFVFMAVTTIFLLMQQVVIQPFGGDVFGMSVAEGGALTVAVTLGMIVGMVVAGRPAAERGGHRAVARTGLFVGAAAFAALAVAAATRSEPAAWLALAAVGFGLGVFNVSSLALMMGMAVPAHGALFMGAWTLAHAIADGVATAGAGVVYPLFRALTGTVEGGYAGVFGFEALGLLACVPLLARVDPDLFAMQASDPARAVSPARVGAS